MADLNLDSFKDDGEINDMAVIMTCHLRGKYLDRLRDFKKYGLINLRGTKIKVFLLCGSDQVPKDLKEETWPYEVSFVHSERFFDGPKLYDFMTKINARLASRYRWWMKVDDDSVTDISNQLLKLDEEFDWKRAEYIFGDYGPGTERIFENAIRKTKYAARFFEPNVLDKQIWHHEFESCVMSSSCFQMILEDEESIAFFRILSSPENDMKTCWHDQGLAAAARFNKIHGSTCLFMTSRPLINNFSLFGGRFTHMHFMHRECPEWPVFMEMMSHANLSS